MTRFAIRREDALTWRDVSQTVAGIAERSYFHIRPNPNGWNRWQVWATVGDLEALREQEGLR